MNRYRSGYVRVDISDIIEEIPDEELVGAVTRRKLLPKGEIISFADVEAAFDYLRRGDVAEALLRLERIVRPKWKTLADAEAAYQKARAA